MSKLWIVHRHPQSRTALARISGRVASEIVLGGPNEADFADCPSPAAVLLGVEDDFEHELEFVHRMRARLGDTRWILLAAPEDASEAARLFDSVEPQILESLPSPRVLRAKIADAFARRQAESLAGRRSRQLIADRFSAWFSGVEVTGMLSALDPSLGGLPLMVRGVPGSGRALLARYAELFRSTETADGEGADTLRIHASDVSDAGDLVRLLARRADSARSDSRHGIAPSIWIDEVDSLSVSAQTALAGWIAHESPPPEFGIVGARWIATAGPARWLDPLEPALERAFAPLVLEIPALDQDPDAVATFATAMARDWARSVGGPPRELSAGALAALESHPWPGDRSEVDAVLRATFAATHRNPIEAEDLDLGGASPEPIDSRFERSHETRSSLPETGKIADDAFAGTPLVELIEEGEPDPFDAPSASDLDIDAAGEAAIEPAEWLSIPDPDSSGDAVVDESVLLSEASFGIAESEALAETVESPAAKESPPDPSWRRLARSLSHEIRNPLVSIKTFAELLPEHYQDETFRARFADLVGRDVAHISDVMTRIQSVSEQDQATIEATDVSRMLEELLEERRERITQRRLLVLRELERDAPLAWAEPVALRVALAGLIDRALDSLPERGDLFVATRHLERGASGEPRLRILLRHHNPEALGGEQGTGSDADELRPEANVLEYVLAETVARAAGGSLTIDSSGAQESLILFELQTPN